MPCGAAADTDKVDILSWKTKNSRVHAQIKDICAILCGLVRPPLLPLPPSVPNWNVCLHFSSWRTGTRTLAWRLLFVSLEAKTVTIKWSYCNEE